MQARFMAAWAQLLDGAVAGLGAQAVGRFAACLLGWLPTLGVELVGVPSLFRET